MTLEGARLIAFAVCFAADRHADQRRKGRRQRPYFNHLAEVADLLSEATGGDDAALIAAAYLHDTIEDTKTGVDELREQFGIEITSLVLEVTDDKSLPKLERKRLQIETAPKKSPRAKLLKIADATSNIRALAADPPTDWETTRMLDYVDWAGQVVGHCRGLNALLDDAFDAASAEARAAINARTAEGANE